MFALALQHCHCAVRGQHGGSAIAVELYILASEVCKAGVLEGLQQCSLVTCQVVMRCCNARRPTWTNSVSVTAVENTKQRGKLVPMINVWCMCLSCYAIGETLRTLDEEFAVSQHLVPPVCRSCCLVSLQSNTAQIWYVELGCKRSWTRLHSHAVQIC